jgi:hypothetical protein
MCAECKTAEGSRRKLGELDRNWYCTIIGSCLSMGELRAMATKLEVRFNTVSPSDYDVHTGMIRLAAQERSVAKALTKLLDRKHAVSLTRFKRAKAADLERLWHEAVERGEVAGACWAVMSHPATTDDLRNLVFGEVHMLSHQIGAASRADLRRIHQLERDKAALEDKVARQQERLSSEIGAHDAALREMRQCLDDQLAEHRRLAHAEAAAAELDGLRAMVGELQRHLAAETDARRIAQAEARDMARMRAAQAERLQVNQAEIAEMRAELAAVEGRLVGDCVAECDRSCGRPDLCGRCILYVGGRAGHVQHLRRIVEECNGTLVHHDGGFEESMGRLTGLLGAADTVMFPVDCVSHMAHDQVKRLCKRLDKPFVPVRRSGLGAFMRALEGMGTHPHGSSGGGGSSSR